jgi:Uma2 family endonuclease
MSTPLEKMNQKFTYSDYLSWDDDERWELIDGVPYNMTPAPSTEHQRIAGQLFLSFGNYLQGKSCQVFFAPFDVRMAELHETDQTCRNVVQPDLVVICDSSKIDGRGCKGAPDLVVEILSPATAKKDVTLKLSLYERFGVKEYWIVDPVNQYIQVYTLKEDRKYGSPAVYSHGETIPVSIFADLQIDLTTIFT